MLSPVHPTVNSYRATSSGTTAIAPVATTAWHGADPYCRRAVDHRSSSRTSEFPKLIRAPSGRSWPVLAHARVTDESSVRSEQMTRRAVGLYEFADLAGRSAVFQRNPADGLAVVIGVDTDVTGAVGGVVVVTVAGGADLTVSVPTCSLATATAPNTWPAFQTRPWDVAI
jgi:hypothetical protein